MPSPKGRRKPRELNQQQRMFAECYHLSGNVTQSYRQAYPTTTAESSCATAGSRLLKDVKVKAYLNELRSKQTERVGLTSDWAITQMMDLFNDAKKSGDYNAAASVLNMIAKHLGLYEVHQKQKHGYTQEDVERLKNELKEKGFDLNRLNDRSDN